MTKTKSLTYDIEIYFNNLSIESQNDLVNQYISHFNLNNTLQSNDRIKIKNNIASYFPITHKITIS